MAKQGTTDTYGYYHSDHLGSSNVITDQTGTQVSLTEYNPWGSTKTQVGTYNPEFKYNGKELDATTGLYYYGARYYDTETGRWTQGDNFQLDFTNYQSFKEKTNPNNPVLANRDKAREEKQNKLKEFLGKPQNLNPYGYVSNNPIKYVDPNGQIFFLAPLLLINPVTAYMVANTLWDLANVGLSAYYFAKDQSSQNAMFLSGDLTALANPLLFGGFGTLEAVKNSGKLNNKMMEMGQGARSSRINVEINWSKQGGHIIGNKNYDPARDKSILTHSDPQGLINRFFGTGEKFYNQGRLQKEVVDFGENIGIYINKDGTIKIPTTRGTIHYAQDGTHIVPAYPNELIK